MKVLCAGLLGGVVRLFAFLESWTNRSGRAVEVAGG